jgi:hypothetical protein
LKRENCPTVPLNGKRIPQGGTAKYIFDKRKELGVKFQQMY